ncbi:hypothetical protein [Ovoidimarina sediminis]|uniref:hypothetical protein n=1 Tax=Ovoidimarina sediminis TaxID=3079856 RepID=UPI002909749F|nr:hypothetical protein [Rhodophyticola sp. MJ-SS7]MDU8946091.1 hypothetical protein [Rhodophyticola sp. MJ-SS7]
MNADRLIQMLLRHGIRFLSRRMSGGAAASPEDRARQKKTKQTARAVKSGLRMARRMGRF